MYEAHHGLNERPFDLTANPRFLFLSSGHREALSNLQHGVEARKGITLLLGEAGTGKTTLLRAVLEQQRAAASTVTSVYLSNPTLTRSEFYDFLATGFGLSAEAAASKTVFLRELEAMLPGATQRGPADGADRRRGAEPAARAARGDPAAGQSRNDDGEAAVGGVVRTAGTRGAPERAGAASVETARRAALRAEAVRPARDGGLYRQADTHCGRRFRITLYEGRGRVDPARVARHCPHDQRGLRQRAGARSGVAAPSGGRRYRGRSLPGFRPASAVRRSRRCRRSVCQVRCCGRQRRARWRRLRLSWMPLPAQAPPDDTMSVPAGGPSDRMRPMAAPDDHGLFRMRERRVTDNGETTEVGAAAAQAVLVLLTSVRQGLRMSRM